jgi:hypothetical protein
MEGVHDREKILADFARGPQLLEESVAGLTDRELDYSAGEGEWSIRQIVHHVADGDDLWKSFVKAALGRPEGMLDLAWYWAQPQAAWASHWNYAGRPIGPSLELLRASRRHIGQLLEAIPGAWERELLVRWPNESRERVAVGAIIELQANHVLSHVARIHQLRASIPAG